MTETNAATPRHRQLVLIAPTSKQGFVSALLAELLADAKSIKPEELALLYQRQARLAALTGDRDGQLAVLKKALDTDRKNVAIANELADLAETLGDDDLALRALRQVRIACGQGDGALSMRFVVLRWPGES
jgi:hypothetical protein